MWFNDVFATEPKIVCNRFACVSVRVTSSPFLLNGTERKHTSNCSFDSDFVTGGEGTVEKAYLLFRKLKLRFLEGRFNLREWRTNDKD